MAIGGASLIWLPFAALTGLSLLAFVSSPGLPERNWPLTLLGLLFVVLLPIVVWLALRRPGIGTSLVVGVIGAAIPILWAPQIQPDHSEPLHLLARVTVIGGGAMVLGGLLMAIKARPGN